MTPTDFMCGKIHRLRSAFPVSEHHSPWVDAVNVPDTPPKQRRIALKGLVNCNGPCWLESQFHLSGTGKITFAKYVFANHNLTLLADDTITVGEGTFFGPNVVVSSTALQVEGIKTGASAPVSIGKSVWVGANAVILPGVTIGDGAIVGANAIVNQDVPAGAMVVGKPAEVVSRSGQKAD